MKPGKITTMMTAVALILAPTAATAASAPQDPGVRASAEMTRPGSIDEGTTVFLGLLLLILFAIAVLSDSRGQPNNVPASP